MSISSQMSDMSVSYCGSEVPLADALDQVFTELQGTLNSLHCATRTLAMMPDQDNDYLEELDQVLQISDGVDQMTELFKELKSVAKQVLAQKLATAHTTANS